MEINAKQVDMLWLAVISIATIGCYFQVYNFQFVYDSVGFVLHNPHIHAFSIANTGWILTHAWLQDWQPVTWLSHTLDFELFGDWAGGPHLVNLAFHLANSLLLYFLVRRLFRNSSMSPANANWIAGITAFIFALHPQHVESVAMIAERKDMLYGFFTLLCTFTYLHMDASISGSPQRRRLQAALIVLYLLDLMAKPMAVTLPLVFVAMDALVLGKGTSPGALLTSLKGKLSMLVLAGLVTIVTLITQRSAMFPWQIFTIRLRAVHALHNLGFYTVKFLLPVDLSPYYPFPTLTAMLQPGYWLPGLLFIVVTTAACGYALRRRQPGFLFGWIYFLVTIAPVSGFLQVGSASATDHYVYMATIPFGAFLGWLSVTLVQRLPPLRSLVVPLTGCYLVGLVMLAWVQIGFWQSPFRLWGRALALYPTAQLPRRNLAISYMQAGAYDKALAEVRKMAHPDIHLIEDIQHHKAAMPQ